eukprot:GFUD01037773.1.p1 GENE.GFUD01037773.1~~GFUD01037773.1.p1  ORF type:complete len:517 (+),score=127.69 GFUD01037773.1:69-1619(+)
MIKNERSDAKSSKRNQLLATFFATIGSFGLGTVLSWPAPTLPQLSAQTCSAECGDHLVLSTEQQSWVAALINFGAFTAGPIAGILMPRYGKKWTMMLLSVPIFIGWLFLIFACNVEMLYVGRFLTGFSGAFSLLAPGYIAEICQVEIRGALASFMQVMTMMGLLSTYTIGTWLDWRRLSAVCSVIPLLVILCLYFIPRSPMFLLSMGLKEEARSSLKFYRGGNVDVTQELLKLQASTEESTNVSTVRAVSLLSNKTYLKPLCISLMLMLLQQFSGIKVISSYIVQIFQNAGSKFDANICSIVVGVIQVTGTSISVLVVDKFGRRRLLILSEMFISIAFCMLGTFFFIQESHLPCPTPETCQDQVVTAETVDNLAWLPLASIVTFAVAYSMGMGPLPWVLNAELFSKEAKATSSSLCASFNWLCSFMVVKFSPSIETVIGASGSYLSFAALAAVGTLLIVITVPETKGRTEEEIKQLFEEQVSDSGDAEGGRVKIQNTEECDQDLLKPLVKERTIEI